MATIGLHCPPVPGHLNPATALGRALVARGHKVIAFNIPESRARREGAGLSFHPIGAEIFPDGAFARRQDELAAAVGPGLLGLTVELIEDAAEMTVRDLPDALRAEGVELMIGDEIAPGIGAVCAHLGVPWVTLSAALLSHPDPAIPPIFLPWGPTKTAAGVGGAWISLGGGGDGGDDRPGGCAGAGVCADRGGAGWRRCDRVMDGCWCRCDHHPPTLTTAKATSPSPPPTAR